MFVFRYIPWYCQFGFDFWAWISLFYLSPLFFYPVLVWFMLLGGLPCCKSYQLSYFFQYYYVYLNDRFNSLCYTCQFYSLSKDLHFKSCFRSWKIASFQCYSFTLISTGCFFFFFLLVLNIWNNNQEHGYINIFEQRRKLGGTY